MTFVYGHLTRGVKRGAKATTGLNSTPYNAFLTSSTFNDFIFFFFFNKNYRYILNTLMLQIHLNIRQRVQTFKCSFTSLMVNRIQKENAKREQQLAATRTDDHLITAFYPGLYHNDDNVKVAVKCGNEC